MLAIRRDEKFVAAHLVRMRLVGCKHHHPRHAGGRRLLNRRHAPDAVLVIAPHCLQERIHLGRRRRIRREVFQIDRGKRVGRRRRVRCLRLCRLCRFSRRRRHHRSCRRLRPPRCSHAHHRHHCHCQRLHAASLVHHPTHLHCISISSSQFWPEGRRSKLRAWLQSGIVFPCQTTSLNPSTPVRPAVACARSTPPAE